MTIEKIAEEIAHDLIGWLADENATDCGATPDLCAKWHERVAAILSKHLPSIDQQAKRIAELEVAITADLDVPVPLCPPRP